MMPLDANATIGDVLEDDPELSTFNNFVRRTGFIAQLDEPGEWTVFAPTNDAFDALPPGTLGALTQDGTEMRRVVSFHIAPGIYAAEGIAQRSSVPTLYGRDILVVVADEGMAIGGSSPEEVDIQASNGFIHKMAQVMFPD